MRAWRKSGQTEFWAELATDVPDSGPFWEALERASEAHMEWGITARLTGTAPMGYVALINGVDSAEDLAAWADAVGQRLSQAGVNGVLRGAKEAPFPHWVSDTAELTAFITWSYGADKLTTAPTSTRPLWKLDERATRTIAGLVADFVAPGGPTIAVGQGAFSFSIARHAGLCASAQTVLQYIGGETPWNQRIHALTDTITAHPELIDHAAIRPAKPLTPSWDIIDVVLPLPHVHESAFRYNQHLTTRYVLDAHGVQVLTDRQLERLHNPGDWNIRDLGHGRHLVTAPDLTPWYSTSSPDPDTLERARRDFADVILTPEAIEANPPPWRQQTRGPRA